MATPLNARDAALLARICCMLGSDHDGERATAAAFATCKLKELGLTWEVLVSRAAGGATAEVEPQRHQPQDRLLNTRAQIRWLLCQNQHTTDWERQFAYSLAGQSRPLSAKQVAKVGEVVARVEARGAGPCSA